MEERLINELIEQLRQNLENVESARQQVENTVQAYNAMREDVSMYTSELSFITQNVRTLISQLEEIKERFLGNISTQIVDEIHTAVTTLTSTISGVSLQISSLRDFTNTQAEQIISDIKQRTDFIDTTLCSTRTDIGAISVDIALCVKQLEQLTTSLQSLTDREQTHYDAIVKKLEDQEKKLDVIQKWNMVFSIIIIVLLFIIGGFIIYNYNS